MEAAVEDDHRAAPGERARDLHRVLDGLGAGADQQRLVLAVAAARRQLGEPAADLDVRLVHRDHEALVQVAVGLRVDRGDDLRRVVAEVQAAEAAGEVDERRAVGVGDRRAARRASATIGGVATALET